MNESTDFLKFPSGATVRRIKKDARKMAKARNISHGQALDMLASQHGVNAPWAVAITRLQTQSSAGASVRAVPILKTDSDVFHCVQIGPLIFTAFVNAADIHLSMRRALGQRKPSRWWYEVPLGPAVICFRPIGLKGLNPDNSGDGNFWICKYDPHQGHIPLAGLSDDEVALVAAEFGIHIQEEETFDVRRMKGFFESPAWKSLQVWVEAHPRLAKNGLDANYLDWYRSAVRLIGND